MDENKRTISQAVTVSLCIWVVLFSINLLLEDNSLQENSAVKGTGKSWSSSWPKLVKYDQFLEHLEREGELKAQMSPLEHSRRWLVFNNDLIDVSQHNLAALAGLETYYLQQTWTDWSEFKPLFVNETEAHGQLEEEPVRSHFMSKFFSTGEEAKKNVEYFDDHRDCLGPARHQLKCGACYAFSVIALIEWHYCKQHGNELADFSEQYAVDCGSTAQVRGCAEGRLSFVKNFYCLYGLKREADWPYIGKERKQTSCTADELEANRIQMNLRLWRRIEVSREIFERTLEFEPILISLYLAPNFERYKSGIFVARQCSARRKHGVLLVGHGSEDGKQFWLIRNSHGENWGESGYMRMSKEMDAMENCFKEAYVSHLKFEYDEERSDALYDSFAYSPPEFKVVPRKGMSRSLIYQ